MSIVGHRLERITGEHPRFPVYVAVACAFSLVLAFLAPGTRAATLIWTDGSGNFTNPANWSTATAPAPGDTTIFTNDTSYTVTFTANAVNMNSNFFNGQTGIVTLDITGFSWALTNNSATAGRGAFVVGQAAGSTATVYLAGGSLFVTNSISTPNARLLVGGSGAGAFYITNGTVVVNRTILGDTATGLGLLVLDGGGVTYSNSSTFIVGNNTASTGNALVISNSATLTSASTFTLGNNSSGGNSLLVDSGGRLFTLNAAPVVGSASSNNTVTISGSGSKWDLGGQTFTVGSGAATGNVLTISGGGSLTNASTTTVGNGAGANGNSLVVTGNGSTWTNSARLLIGSGSYSNRITISDGGKVSAGGGGNASGIGLNGTNNTALITGSGSVWRDGALVVGLGANAIGNTLTISSGGQVVSTGGGAIGSKNVNADTGATSNSVWITGAGSLWTNTTSFIIGGMTNATFNSLVIGDGGKLYSGGLSASSIGAFFAANNNSALITDMNSLWQVAGSGGFILGDRGQFNSLLLANGGMMTVITGGANVGNTTDGNNNAVLVTGNGSAWSNTALLRVGVSGSSNAFTVADDATAYSGNGVTVGESGSGNSLLVSGGGVIVNAAGALSVGSTATAMGNSLTVTGGSVFTNGSLVRVIVGSLGSSNSLAITGGSKLYSSSGTGSPSGVGAGGSNNTAVVSGAGSLWQDGSLIVGNGGAFNTLTITNNGLVSIKAGGIASGSAATRNSVLIADGGVLTNTSVGANPYNLGGGANASFNSLTISNGGKMYVSSSASANLDVGGGVGANSNAVLVTGGNSLLQINSVGFRLGFAGNGNTLSVSDGGQFFSGPNVIGETGSNNFAVVTGSGSVWSNGSANGTMVLGNGANSINNGLTVSQGGKVYSAGNPAGSIGLGVNANSNSVTVTDSGSLWNIAGTLTVGASGASNNLTVSNGGQVTTTGHAWLGSATNTSVNNSIVVTGNGSMLQVGGTVSVGSNTVVNANTRGIGGNILVQNGGTLEGNILVSGAAVGGVSSGDITNNAGIYQFTSPTPSIIANTASNIAIAGGTISFRNVASASVYANVVGPGNQLTNMAFSGNNTFRLNNSSNTTGVAAYNFDSGFGATNYHRLELVNGTTLWRSSRLNIGGTSGSMLVSNTTARIAAVVTNQGSIQVVNSIATWSSNSVVSGAFITDPSTNIFQANLTVTSSGYLSGGAGDLFQFESDFTLQSTQDSLFALDSSTVLFTNGVGQHVFDLTGSNATDDGTNFYGLAAITTNFAIGSFIVAPTDTLRLTGAVFNALYVGALDFGGLSNTNNLTLDVNLYYDSTLAANSYLASTTYDLAGAGMLIPYPGIAEIIPEPSSLAFLLAAGCGLLFRRARGTHTAA